MFTKLREVPAGECKGHSTGGAKVSYSHKDGFTVTNLVRYINGAAPNVMLSESGATLVAKMPSGNGATYVASLPIYDAIKLELLSKKSTALVAAGLNSFRPGDLSFSHQDVDLRVEAEAQVQIQLFECSQSTRPLFERLLRTKLAVSYGAGPADRRQPVVDQTRSLDRPP